MDKVKAVKTLRKLVNERSLEKVGGYIKNLLVEFLKEHQNYLSSGFYHLWLAVSAKDLEKLLLSNIVCFNPSQVQFTPEYVIIPLMEKAY